MKYSETFLLDHLTGITKQCWYFSEAAGESVTWSYLRLTDEGIFFSSPDEGGAIVVENLTTKRKETIPCAWLQEDWPERRRALVYIHQKASDMQEYADMIEEMLNGAERNENEF